MALEITPEQRAAWGVYFLIHDAARKDLDWLGKICSTFRTYDDGRRKAAQNWFNFHKRMLHIHHHGEDEFFFPKVKIKGNANEAQLARMDQDHKAIDKHLEQLTADFDLMGKGKLDKDAFENHINAYQEDLLRHLREEEEFIVPATNAVFSIKEIMEAEAEYRKTVNKTDLGDAFAWFLDVASDNQRNAILSKVPFPVRLLYKLSWRKKYHRLKALFN